MSLKEKAVINSMILLNAFFWGSSYAVRKIGLESMGPFFFNSLRFFLAFLFVASAFLIQSSRSKNSKTTAESAYHNTPILYQIKGGILAGLTYGIGSAFQQWGLMSTVAGKVGFITSLYTIFVPLISWLIMKKTVRKQVWFGAIFAFAGLALISYDSGFGISKGDGAILISAIIFASQIIIIGNFSKRSNPLILVSAQMFTGALISIILSVMFEQGNTLSGAIDGWFAIVYSGIFSLGLANLLQSFAQKKATPSVTAIILSFESVFGAIFGIILLGEQMKLYQYIGCLLIFIAVLVSQYERKKPKYKNLDNSTSNEVM